MYRLRAHFGIFRMRPVTLHPRLKRPSKGGRQVLRAEMDWSREFQQVWRTARSGRRSISEESAVRHLAIRIIDHTPERTSQWHERGFWKACRAAGYDISYGDAPCILTRRRHPITDATYVAEVELQWLCTPAFWQQCMAEPIGLACAVSHLRALAEACHVLGEREQGYICVFERDVTLTENSFLALNWTLRELLCNPAHRDVHYVTLVTSQREDHLALMLPTLQAPPRPHPEDFHYKLGEFPLTWKTQTGEPRLATIGQGTRGYIMSTTFARHLLSTRLSTWIDMWICLELPRFARRQNVEKAAAFLHPPAGVHPVVMADATRGSARMVDHLVNEAARFSPFLTLSLDKGWGVANRLLTLGIFLKIGSSCGLGIHCLWNRTEACPGLLSDIIACPATSPELPGLPFVQIHAFPNHFNPFLSARLQQNLGNYRFQCTVDLFKEELSRQFQELPRVTNRCFHNVLSLEFGQAFQHLLPLPWIRDEASGYLKSWPPHMKHVAVHIRRGDWQKYEMQNAGRGKGMPTVESVVAAYQAADEEVQAHHEQAEHELHEPYRR